MALAHLSPLPKSHKPESPRIPLLKMDSNTTDAKSQQPSDHDLIIDGAKDVTAPKGQGMEDVTAKGSDSEGRACKQAAGNETMGGKSIVSKTPEYVISHKQFSICLRETISPRGYTWARASQKLLNTLY